MSLNLQLSAVMRFSWLIGILLPVLSIQLVMINILVLIPDTAFRHPADQEGRREYQK